jgi:ATP synthase H subunit
MSKTEVLKSIRDAEERTKKNILAAQKKKEDMITEAKKEAQRILEAAESNAHKRYEEALLEAQKDIEHEKQAILSEGNLSASKIRSRAEGRLVAGRERLLSDFVDHVKDEV